MGRPVALQGHEQLDFPYRVVLQASRDLREAAAGLAAPLQHPVHVPAIQLLERPVRVQLRRPKL